MRNVNQNMLLFVSLVGKTSACRQKEGLKLIKYLPLLPRLTAVLPPQGREMPHGFTLIELLVVVLIIGILAAVALPQYQKAVIKSRSVAALLTLKALVQAQEAYYLEKGSYTENLALLDVEIPTELASPNTIEGKHSYRCDKELYVCQAFIANDNVPAFQMNLQRASKANNYCIAKNDMSKSICQSMGREDTGRTGDQVGRYFIIN